MTVAASPAQEAVNALTHALGVVFSVVALVVLVTAAAQGGDAWTIAAFAVFGSTLIFLYLASTLYHWQKNQRVKRILEVFDHVAIYLLIAGSYTAFALTVLRTGPGWLLLAVVWTIATAGIVLEARFLNRWPWLSLGLYLALGWLIVLVWGPLVAASSPLLRTFLVAGGLAYTVGAAFFALGNRWGWFHPVWHLFVLAGSACHVLAALAGLPTRT